MNILYTLNSAQPGGMEQHTLDLCGGMLERGHNVSVWMPEGPLVEKFKGLGAKVTIIKIGFDIDLSYIFKLKSFIKANKITVVHAHEVKAITNTLLAATLAGVHAKISHQHTPISEWQVGALKKFINLAGYAPLINIFGKCEIALTESRKRVKIKEGIKERNLYVIPNGIELKAFNSTTEVKNKYRQEICERYNINQNLKIWGVLSRVSAEKGHMVMLDAFSKYLIGNKTDILFIAGGGPLEKQIREKIEQRGIKSNVVITSRFAEEDKLKFYATFDAFVHPSLAEGFGITLIEAMASNIPIIASDLEVFKEVAGDTVAYFETGNSNDLADKMLNYDRSKTAKALERVHTLYTMDKFISSYERLYEGLITS